MEVKAKPTEDGTKRFYELNLGECYRTENGRSIYMRLNIMIASGTYNTVSIESGCVFHHNADYKVYPVSGTFIEE